jgi:hypothetical protein
MSNTNTKNVVADIVKKIGGLGFVETLRVTGTADDTKVEAIDNEKTVIIKAKTKEVQSDLVGEFGIANLQLLNGLLNFASYKTDDATFNVTRREKNGTLTPTEFEFRDANGLGANFYLMSANLVPEQPLVADSKWDVSFVPAKAKIQEFAGLAGLYSQFDQYFSVKTKDGSLLFSIGDEGSSTHHASMVFEQDIEGELKGELLWPITQFLSILKSADGHEHSVGITSKGALLVSVTTEHAKFDFILPARRR